MPRQISVATALRRAIAARPELAAKVLHALTAPPPQQISSPEDAVVVFRPLLLGLDHEAFAVLGLTTANKVVDAAVLTRGSDRLTVVDPLQILRWTLSRSRACPSIIVAHNHPSGDCQPSQQDRAITTVLDKACRAVGIRLLDHLILADPFDYMSFANRGELLPHKDNAAPYTS